jgi:hypothetical protein
MCVASIQQPQQKSKEKRERDKKGTTHAPAGEKVQGTWAGVPAPLTLFTNVFVHDAMVGRCPRSTFFHIS